MKVTICTSKGVATMNIDRSMGNHRSIIEIAKEMFHKLTGDEDPHVSFEGERVGAFKQEPLPENLCKKCGKWMVLNPADLNYYCVTEGCPEHKKCSKCGDSRAVCSC